MDPGQGSLLEHDVGRVTFASPSALDCYEHCPRLYRFLYVDRLWQLRRADPAQSFGSSVHAALRELFRLPPARRSVEVLLALLDRGWVDEGYRDAGASRRERQRARQALRAWYARSETALVPQATEVGLAARFGDIVLNGRLDRVDREGDDLVIVDYKTSSRPAKQDVADRDRTLGIYAVLAGKRLGRRVDRMVLDYVVAGVAVATRRSAEQLRAQLDGALDLAHRLRADRAFEARTGPWCAGCDLLSRCPEGKAVASGAMTGRVRG